ncbi:MAG: ATP-binding cassette domain-containing protein [Solirubrobacterales bacterium]|nr:ATP-binding cassette domain-containing protein [Solirubrobacterales bacterium]
MTNRGAAREELATGTRAAGSRAAADGQAVPALELVGISKAFPGVLANDGVSLRVARGEILGLLGENGAGKTTLMNIVYGLYQPDGGEILVGGERVAIRSPQHAVELGIGMVHQHFMLVPDMTVAENVALSPSRSPGLSRLDDVTRSLEELSSRFGLEVEPTAVVEDLPVGACQRVEIIKLLHRGADLLILDEPTAALTPPEWRELSAFLRSLADRGSSVIFITHKLDELFGVADRCTVLRDGRVVGSVPISETDKPSLARMMVGREITLRVDRPMVEPGEPVLEVDGLTLVEDGRTILEDVDFRVRAGEVFGVAGVGGNGQNELVEVLIGLRSATAGEIRLGGRRLDRLDPSEFVRQGGAVIPEDRQHEGVALELSVLDNLLMREFDRPSFSRWGVIDPDKARGRAERLVAEYDVRTPGVGVPMRQLSGGNQQKAVLARELGRDPRLVIAFQPTRGLDVGAIEFVYRKLNEQKRAGVAILLISFELDEILSMTDRFTVMVGGRFPRVLEADEADPETVGLLMGGEAERA